MPRGILKRLGTTFFASLKVDFVVATFCQDLSRIPRAFLEEDTSISPCQQTSNIIILVALLVFHEYFGISDPLNWEACNRIFVMILNILSLSYLKAPLRVLGGEMRPQFAELLIGNK